MNKSNDNFIKNNLSIYSNWLNNKDINKIKKDLNNGEITQNKAMVTAYNIANVKYKQNILRFVPEAVKIFAPNAMKINNLTSKVMKIKNMYPKYPPCIPSKNGKGDARKTVEAFSKQCAAYCGRKVQNLGRKVTRQTKLTVAQRNAISKIKRTRISENNKRMFIKLIKNGENIKRVQKGVSRAREMYENRANKYV
jgi:hypothetical protein